MGNKTNPNKGIDPDVTLKKIEKVLQSDANYKIIEPDQKGKGIKPKIVIEDSRFQRIKDLINKNNSKNNRNYRKLIELISEYIGQIYDKKDFDQGTICSVEYYNKQSDANHKFVEQLFDYICKILTSNPDISLSADTLKKLLKKRSKKNSYEERRLSFDKLANILRKNKTLNNSQISVDETYQILIDTFQLSNREIFTALITPEQFNKNHELIDEYLKTCYSGEFVSITDTIKENFDGEFDRLPLILEHKEDNFIEDLIHYFSYFRTIKKEDFDIMHKVLSDKNRKINFHRDFPTMDDDLMLYEVIRSYGDKTLIRDMLEHPSSKDVYNFETFVGSTYLCEIYCYLGEYEIFLNKLNKERYNEFLSKVREKDNILKQNGYISGDESSQNILSHIIAEICESLKSQNIDYERVKHIIELIINDGNLNCFAPNIILPRLQKLLSEEDFKKILNTIAQKQKNEEITLTRAVEEKINDKFKITINKISVEEFKEMIKEYIGHQKSIGTNPTSQDD